jgi:hypothetical protein
MKQPMRTLRGLLSRHSQAGQSIVLLAIAMIALIAFIGLVTDIALLFVRYSTLRRAVDSAAIAAAGQVREGRTHMDIVSAAYQFVELHGIGVDAINEVFVETCDTNPGDPELCTVPRRKLVRVTAQISSPTLFLRLMGWGTVRLQATATAEAAAVDIALVLDTSESMSKETNFCMDGGNPACDYAGVSWGDLDNGRFPARAFSWGDPWNDEKWGLYCNDPNGDGFYDDLACQPFKQVREAAAAFIGQLDFVRGDRVILITFDRYAVPHDPDGAGPLPPVIDNEALARDVLMGEDHDPARPGIGVYHNPEPSDGWNVCWTYRADGGWSVPWSYEDVAPCGNTNLGGGVRAADNALRGYHPVTGADMGTVRHEAVWIMVLLTDGAANVTDPRDPLPEVDEYGYWGYCPSDTFLDHPDYPGEMGLLPFCRDEDAYSRHGSTNAAYDADDYARDWADSAGLSPEEGGDFIAIFTIGLGNELINGRPRTDLEPPNALDQPWHGETLLRYIADVGDNGHRDGIFGEPVDPDSSSTSECENKPHGEVDGIDPTCGNFYFAPDANGLQTIFAEIASRMFTRVAR